MITGDVFFRRVFKPLVFLSALLPFAIMLRGAWVGDLGANPLETVTHGTGDWALRFLLLTLAMTPLRRLLHRSWPLRMRRMLGLYAFFYASLHFLIWLVLDQELSWHNILGDIAKRPYITVGFTAWLLLVPLAATSTRWAMRRLGRRWTRLHRLVYPTAVLAVVHYLWLVKADLFEPLLYGAILAVLLLARLRLPHGLRLRATPPVSP
jgi:sulfoxide reductase heme-binding subunit YedZ